MEVSNASRLKPSVGAEVATVDDTGVIVDTRSGKCWQLNAVGLEIWQLIAAGKSVGETIDTVAARYSIPTETSRTDVMSLVQSLLREGLLAPTPASGSTVP
jgi:hypothetical protein